MNFFARRFLSQAGSAIRNNPLIGTTRYFSQVKLLSLDNLRVIPGSKKKRKRVGRGPGSGLGKTCGYGHQFSRSTPRGFEGGQTPLWRRLPKRGMKNPFRKDYNTVNLDTIKTCIIQKRFTPQPDRLITMRDLVTAGVTNNIKDGIHLLGRGGRNFKFKIHLEVSKASRAAIEAIEKAGGTVTCTYFSKLALRALVKPWKFDLLPWRPRPAPVPMQFYLDKNNCGYLAPEIQKRNLKLFGAATSEKMYREEHYCTLVVKREQWKVQREKQAKGFLESREKHARKLEARAERDRLKQQAENVSI